MTSSRRAKYKQIEKSESERGCIQHLSIASRKVALLAAA
uniref:Uncharacterized protein n=1 Tax=Populus trichocarpa TaxID=3694 RepID=A0A3N7EVI7_POPTR